MDYTYLVFDETMKHHGVKGMHWGIRRYQNPDGSLTAAGKKHVKLTIGNTDPINYLSTHKSKMEIKSATRVLTQKERNKKLAELAADKRSGKITSKERKDRIRIADEEMKAEREQVKKELKALSPKDAKFLREIATNAKDQVVREIPYNRVKEGMRFIENFTAAVGVASGVAQTGIGVATLNPLLVTSGAATIIGDILGNRMTRAVQKRVMY